ncbi:MAG: hypothetical protein ABIS86_22890 [Streptosporangiaceae bacterium]
MKDRGPDDMGDDEQETETGEYERYIGNPPNDLVIEEQEGHEVGISEWTAEETRRGEPEEDEPGQSPENAALHITPDQS